MQNTECLVFLSNLDLAYEDHDFGNTQNQVVTLGYQVFGR